MPERAGDGEGEDEDEYEDEGPAMNFNWFDDLFVYDTGAFHCSSLSLRVYLVLTCMRRVETNTWQQVEAKGQIPSPRAAFGMDVVGSSIYVFGGRDTTKRQNDLYVVRPSLALSLSLSLSLSHSDTTAS